MEKENELFGFLESYENYLSSSFYELWSLVELEYDKLDAYSVIGSLLSRQVTLSIQLARSPNSLNGHIGPLYLRAMVDLYITLAWIMKDLDVRAKIFIHHGLGEEKLLMEHYKKEIEENPDDPDIEDVKRIVEVKSDWINSQRLEHFVEVNLGNWAQLDSRRMAQEADCEDLYKFAYKPFSLAAHSMWPHVSIYNSKICENPLHRYHLVPELVEAPGDLDFLYRSSKYVHKAYQLFLDHFDIVSNQDMPLEWWDNYFSSESDPPESQEA